ncbi:uncharacterized protein LOC111635614 [Centruroides sculpturatus]|uniref:uncharacterized protein LOC111635614 n=1 Tax=Centruroides sculpturatus TaxID=218467 RepID=UPI000C6D0495|nr:uncharacterized protein LOC111635614 [Centruroides sculpturatus]
MFINEVNKIHGSVFLLDYFILMLLTCLFIYNVLFVKMHEIVALLAFSVTLLFLVACLMVASLVSTFNAAMQNSFQDIWIFADCRLDLEQRLKILNFMKRFGKVPLAISAQDFFIVTKKFPIKMANSLYSIYSSLLNLRSAEQKTVNCSKKSLL